MSSTSTDTNVFLVITDRTYDGDTANDLRTLRICKNKEEVAKYEITVCDYIENRDFQNEVQKKKVSMPADAKYLVVPVHQLYREDGCEDVYDVDIQGAYFVKSRNDVFRDTEEMDITRRDYSHIMILDKSVFEWDFANAAEDFPQMVDVKTMKKTVIKLAAPITGW